VLRLQRHDDRGTLTGAPHEPKINDPPRCTGNQGITVRRLIADLLAARINQRLDPLADRIIARAQADGTLRPDIGRTDVILLNFLVGLLHRHADPIDRNAARRTLEVVLEGLRARPTRPDLPGRPPTDAALHAILASLHDSR
jgi:hypothetical protein